MANQQLKQGEVELLFLLTCKKEELRHCLVRARPGSHDAGMYSYNCEAPPNPLLVEVDCHWLAGTAVVCCVIQVISALWPPLLPEPLIKKKRTVPFFTSAASWAVVKMGSLPENPPSAMTG